MRRRMCWSVSSLAFIFDVYKCIHGTDQASLIIQKARIVKDENRRRNHLFGLSFPGYISSITDISLYHCALVEKIRTKEIYRLLNLLR